MPYNIAWVTSFFFYNARIAMDQKLEFGHKLFYFKKYFIYFYGHKN